MEIKRRGALFGVMVVATVLALSSAAFACAVFKGKGAVVAISYSGSTAGGTSTAIGDNTTHGYCSTPVNGANITGNHAPSFDLTVQSTTDCGGSKLSRGVYIVYYAENDDDPNIDDCSHPNENTTFPGVMTVNGSGSGSYQGAAPSYLVGRTTAICVADPIGLQGIQIPVDWVI